MAYTSSNLLTHVVRNIDFTQPSLYISAASIAFNPIFWNIAARAEYRNHWLTKLSFNKPRLGCYILAVAIFSLGILRDYLYHEALKNQPTHPWLQSRWLEPLTIALFSTGNILVLSSMWRLGVTGTYLGDYFGIFDLDEMVTGFPFDLTSAPMYWGSSMSFAATALWYGKPAGLLLTGLVVLMYAIALTYEDPFTAEIYRKRDLEKKKDGGKKSN